eukprot:3521557-Pyramimonas_sp.AAC.1
MRRLGLGLQARPLDAPTVQRPVCDARHQVPDESNSEGDSPPLSCVDQVAGVQSSWPVAFA